MDLKDFNYQLRMPTKMFVAFNEKCNKLGRSHTDVARELFVAFAEGRLRIVKTESQKEENIYVD